MFVYDKLFQKLNDAKINEYMLEEYYEFSRSVVRRIKNNQGISMENLERLAMIFNCTTADLYEYVDFDGRMANYLRRTRQKIRERYMPKGIFRKWELQFTGDAKRKLPASGKDRESG